MRTHSRRTFLKWFGSGAVSAVCTMAYGDWAADYAVLEKHELVLPKWDADGFRIGLFSDTHVGSARALARAQKALKMLIDEKPDVIAFAGDFVNSAKPSELRNLMDSVEMLRDVNIPSVAVMGNHDYWTGYTSEVIRHIEATPLKLLRNEAVEIDGVTIAGIDDAVAGRNKIDFLHSDKHSKSLLTVFHEPDFVDDMPNNVSLQLSGHSHGGQICLPGGFSLHTPRGARKYIRGYFPDTAAPLYVSRGVGTTGPNWRTFCTPEVTVLTLRGA